MPTTSSVATNSPTLAHPLSSPLPGSRSRCTIRSSRWSRFAQQPRPSSPHAHASDASAPDPPLPPVRRPRSPRRSRVRTQDTPTLRAPPLRVHKALSAAPFPHQSVTCLVPPSPRRRPSSRRGTRPARSCAPAAASNRARVPRLAQKLTRSAARPCRMIEAKKPLKAKLAGELAAAADESERKEIKVCMKWKAIPQRVPRGLTPTSPFDRPSSRRASVRWSTTYVPRICNSDATCSDIPLRPRQIDHTPRELSMVRRAPELNPCRDCVSHPSLSRSGSGRQVQLLV